MAIEAGTDLDVREQKQGKLTGWASVVESRALHAWLRIWGFRAGESQGQCPTQGQLCALHPNEVSAASVKCVGKQLSFLGCQQVR